MRGRTSCCGPTTRWCSAKSMSWRPAETRPSRVGRFSIRSGAPSTASPTTSRAPSLRPSWKPSDLALITLPALRKQIASGDTAPLYMLVGEDELEKSAVAGEFAEIVDEGLRPFNVDRFYGGDAKVDTVIDAARTLPMMAPRRIVVVLEAEKLLVPRRESQAAEAEQARLEEFLQAVPSHATVVFVCGALDERRRVVKLLLKQAVVVDCGTIFDAADAEQWLKRRAAK